jgi:hypothetical protein
MVPPEVFYSIAALSPFALGIGDPRRFHVSFIIISVDLHGFLVTAG